jgi:hypothetical protein
VWWLLSMRNITTDSMYTLLGTPVQKLLLTACHFTGPGWNLNNSYEETIFVGGSDCVFFPDGCFLDSPSARHPASGAGRFHLHFNFMDKSFIGPMYITSEDKWGACRIDGPNYNAGGSTNGGPLIFVGTRFEGHNTTDAAFGSTFRMDGGMAVAMGCWFAYGMEAPATAARSPQDAGTVHVFGGAHFRAIFPTFDRSAAAAESVPFIYASGSDTVVRLLEVAHGSRNGVWAGLPRVQAASSAQVKASDGTYTVI